MVGKLPGTVCFSHEAGHMWTHKRAAARREGANSRQSRRHRFQRDVPKSLRLAREEENVRRRIRLREILTFATNMEHAGDVIDKNLLGIGNKMVKRSVTFSKSGQAELLAMIDRLIANARTAASLFMTGDQRIARQLAGEKEIFRTMESTATDAHFQRLREGHAETVETSTLHLDALRDLKSVNANLVAAAAYPILERHGELLPTRLRLDAV